MVEVHFHADVNSYGSEAVIVDGIIARLPESYSVHTLSSDDEVLTVFETLISDDAFTMTNSNNTDDELDAVYEAFLDAFEKTLAENYKADGNPNAETEASEAREGLYCWIQMIEDD